MGVPTGHVADLPERADRDAERERIAALDLAYGLFSRGNNAGGLAHIDDFVGKNDDIRRQIDEYDWFFRRALKWESAEAGLLLGQRLLSLLLRAGRADQTLKVLSRCLHEDARFRPLPADCDELRAVAAAAGRQELAKW